MTNDPASLDRLQDIVVPPPIPWWPLAPGWYVVAALLLLIFLLLLARFISRYRANAYRRAALRELEELECRNRVQELPVLLKRVALAAYPRTEIASLTGERWVAWLAQHGGGVELGGTTVRFLVDAVYSPASAQTISAEEYRNVTATIRKWIRSHPRKP